jgi:hypothetical protein
MSADDHETEVRALYRRVLEGWNRDPLGFPVLLAGGDRAVHQHGGHSLAPHLDF